MDRSEAGLNNGQGGGAAPSHSPTIKEKRAARLSYGSITVDCINFLILKVSLWEGNLTKDDGPFWRCTLSIATEAKYVMAMVDKRIELKAPYLKTFYQTATSQSQMRRAGATEKRRLKDEELVLNCEGLRKAMRLLAHLFQRGELFDWIYYVGDIIKWHCLRRFEAPGACQLIEGKEALNKLKLIHADLLALREKIPGFLPELKPEARLHLPPR